MSNPTADKIKAEMDAMKQEEVPQLGGFIRKPKASKDEQKRGNQMAGAMKGFH